MHSAHAHAMVGTPACATQQHRNAAPNPVLVTERWALKSRQGAARPLAARVGVPRTSSSSSTRTSLVCRAGPSSPQAFNEDPAASQLPQSREQAVQQACTAIAGQLTDSKKVKAKGFAGSGSTKFTVDIPVADGSAAAALALAQELVAGLPPQLRSQFTIVSCLEGASSKGAQVVGLQQCVAEGRALSGCLLIVGATKQQMADVSRVLASWKGPGAVLLNADWWSDDLSGLPADHAAFAGTFEAIYSFVPLEIKAFVTTQQGAVFKWVRSGAPSSTPWRIFSLEGTSWAGVGRMQRRPSSADIESAFYNASAAKSPITQGAKFLKGLIPGGKK